MKTKHRKAARHKRQWQANPMASLQLINKLQPYTDGEQAEFGIHAYAALNNITAGNGCPRDLDILTTIANVCLILSEQTHQECVDVCLRAGQSIIDAKNRWRKHARTGFDGAGLQNVRNLLHLHEQYLQKINPARHDAAYRETLRRMDAGLFMQEAAA